MEPFEDRSPEPEPPVLEGLDLIVSAQAIAANSAGDIQPFAEGNGLGGKQQSTIGMCESPEIGEPMGRTKDPR